MTAHDGDDDLSQVVEPLLASLADRWQASDSDSYAAHYHPEADFVDVLGRTTRGREAIARVHRRNFDTIHLGSRITLERLAARKLAEGVALVHVRGTLSVPAGPLAGDSLATQTLVLVHGDGGWQIRAFHYTFVWEMPGVPSLPSLPA